jgi:hypothetical protein
LFYLHSRGPQTMSILSIRNLCEKILAPILHLPKKRGEEKDVGMTIRRRVEVTVERETVSIIVSGQRRAPAHQPASRESDFGLGRLEPSVPQLPSEAADSGQAKHPGKRRSE